MNTLCCHWGLCNVPCMFQHLMNEVMKGYIDDFVGVYLGDNLVYTDGDAKDYERYLQKVFDCLQKHKLHAKLKKCDFGKDRVKYLGHVVGSGELQVAGRGRRMSLCTSMLTLGHSR